MYLSELFTVNHKSCKNCYLQLDNNNPNILIGINDCGKSTILQSIGLLLDAKPKFNYSSDEKKKDDISNTRLDAEEFEKFFTDRDLPVIPYSQSECVILGKFALEESDVSEANVEGLSNHLLWVLEKANDNVIWLARIFNEEERKHSDFILTLDNEEEPRELYKANNTSLNKQKNSLGITNDEIENENRTGRFRNIELIRAIYQRYTQKFFWAEYKVDKNFWPEFRYLDWNISLDQLNQFANDAIKTKIETQLTSAIDHARGQAEEAQIIVNEELDKFTKSVTSDLPNIHAIKANISFQVNSVVTDLFINKHNSDGDVHLDSQGDGVKRQLWFALIKWNALNSIQGGVTDTKFIWCFDEPETHLYPKAQREFFDIIKAVSHSNVQSIISTHSTVFIDRAKLNTISKIDLEDGYTLMSKCGDVDDIYKSLQIKNSDFLFYDKFLVVEGDTEQILIPHLYELYTGRSLISDSIQIINLGGKSNRVQNKQILTGILQGFKKDINSSIVYLFDNDARFDFTSAELGDMEHTFIGKQDIEDAICSIVWDKLVNDNLGELLTVTQDEIDEIKSNIPTANQNDNNTKVQANQKFYPKLRSHLAIKLREAGNIETAHDILPTKGLDSGKLLTRYIDNVELIAPEIKSIFDKLKNGNESATQ